LLLLLLLGMFWARVVLERGGSLDLVIVSYLSEVL
jgi:hypothetical protein